MITFESGEQIIYTSRRHWYALFAQIAGIVASALAPILGWILLLQTPVANAPSLPSLYAFFSISWLLFVWIASFVTWTNYYLDVLVITNKRVIDIEQHTLFKYDVAEVRFEKIQDIKIAVNGLLPSLLNFGDMTIQTAGEAKEFSLRMVSKPNEVRDIISQQQSILASRSPGRAL